MRFAVGNARRQLALSFQFGTKNLGMVPALGSAPVFVAFSNSFTLSQRPRDLDCCQCARERSCE